MWGEPLLHICFARTAKFQLTRPVWGEPSNLCLLYCIYHISTHSPRVGRTSDSRSSTFHVKYFNSLAPCGANPGIRWYAFASCYFNSLAPCGANPTTGARDTTMSQFQLTRPVWGEPIIAVLRSILLVNFNSLAPCGANLFAPFSPSLCIFSFQLTRPVWGEPRLRVAGIHPDIHFNSLAPCGANPGGVRFRNLFRHFNSLAPCGANRSSRRPTWSKQQFQLTRPVWGEPSIAFRCLPALLHFNSLAPCGANPVNVANGFAPFGISTHSPRVGRTLSRPSTSTTTTISTHSPRVGRTPPPRRIMMATINFNSLAPCGANRGRGRPLAAFGAHFNSLAPCGANPACVVPTSTTRRFQLTRPVWGEPPSSTSTTKGGSISTHSPRVGRTSARNITLPFDGNFNSLAPCGANQGTIRGFWRFCTFQLTRPVWGEPDSRMETTVIDDISTHSPRVGRTCCGV